MKILILLNVYFLILFWMPGISTKTQSVISSIFSPSATHQIALQNKDTLLRSTAIAHTSGRIFIAAGTEGLLIVDPPQFSTNSQITKFGSVKEVATLGDGETIFFSSNGFFSRFKVSKNQSTSMHELHLVAQNKLIEAEQISSLTIFENEDFIAGIAGSILLIYDISTENSIKQVGSFDLTSTGFIINQIFGNTILIMDFEVNFIQMEKISSPDPSTGIMFNLTRVMKITSEFQYYDVKISKDQSYVYIVDGWSGLAKAKLNNYSYDSTSPSPSFDMIFSSWWPTQTIPLLNKMILSKDNKFALVGATSLGLFVFDISGDSFPVLYQMIRTSGFSMQIFFSPNEDYVYYSNGIALSVFEQITPNMFEYVPNLFNMQQANYTDISSNVYLWRCEITKNDEYLVGSFDRYGLAIYELNGNPLDYKLKALAPTEGHFYTDSAIFDQEKGYIISVGDIVGALLIVYDIAAITSQDPSIPFNPVYRLKLSEDTEYLTESIRYSHDHTLIGVSSYSTFFLVDTTAGLLSMKVVGTVSGNNVIDSIISVDNKYALIIQRNFGFKAINLLDRSIGGQFKIENTLETHGAFSIVPSLDGRLAFTGEGPKGLGIIDLMQLPKIVFISRLSLPGTVYHITPIYSGNFLIVTTSVLGFISLVDARDTTNLSVLSKFTVYNLSGLSSCASSDEDYAFLLSIGGITSLPLVSNARVHTEIFRVTGKETNQIIYTKFNLEQNVTPTFEISETYQMQFFLIYPKSGMRLVNVYYYHLFERQTLPYWMSFNLQQVSLDIQAVKEALGTDPTIPNLNTILLEIKVPLTTASFTSSDLSFTDSEATLILQELHNIGYLDFENYLVSSKFERLEPLNFPTTSPASVYNSNQVVLQFIKKLLSQSVTINSILFNVKSSLTFSNVPTSQSKNEFIYSIQSSIQLYIEVSIEMGKFVDMYYDGVIFQISNYATHLKLEGPVENINAIMKHRILFFPLIDDSEITLHIIIKDGVNYVIERDIKMQDAEAFIVKKQSTFINPEINMQKQFNLVYSDGVVNIEESLSFEFSKDTFVNPDTKSISYKAFFCVDYDAADNTEFVENLQGSWMQQSSNSLRFFGLIPASFFRQKLTIRVEASDGYTQTTDEFTMQMNGVPFVYFFSTFIKIFGPIFTVLGCYQYRRIFFNIIFYYENQYAKEVLQTEVPYYKKISLLSDENLKAILLFKQLLNKLHEIPDEQFQQSRRKSEYMLPNSVIGVQEGKQKQSHPSINEIWQSTEIDNGRYSKEFKHLNSIILRIQEQTLHMKQEKQQNAIPAQVFRFPDQTVNKMGELFLKNSGEINLDVLIQQMYNLRLKAGIRTTEFRVDEFGIELSHSLSQLSMSLSTIASRYFLKNHLLLLSIYEFLREIAMLQIKTATHTKVDWYKQYITFTDSKSKDDEINSHSIFATLPSVEVNSDIIAIKLKKLVHSIKKNSTEIGEYLEWILPNLPLQIITDVIKGDALGLLDHVPSIFKKSQGESIHLSFFNISSVEAFKHVNTLYCSLIRRFFKMDYMNYGSSKNQQLPSWMRFKLKPQSIVLSGTPSAQDVESFTIRIFDDTGYILRQFEVEVRLNKQILTQNSHKFMHLPDDENDYLKKRPNDQEDIAINNEIPILLHQQQKGLESDYDQISETQQQSRQSIGGLALSRSIRPSVPPVSISQINLKKTLQSGFNYPSSPTTTLPILDRQGFIEQFQLDSPRQSEYDGTGGKSRTKPLNSVDTQLVSKHSEADTFTNKLS